MKSWTHTHLPRVRAGAAMTDLGQSAGGEYVLFRRQCTPVHLPQQEETCSTAFVIARQERGGQTRKNVSKHWKQSGRHVAEAGRVRCWPGQDLAVEGQEVVWRRGREPCSWDTDREAGVCLHIRDRGSEKL